jgi:hypothetical protein
LPQGATVRWILKAEDVEPLIDIVLRFSKAVVEGAA